MALFDLSWLALADDELAGFAEVYGDVPSVQWVAAFAEGSRSGADPANDTTGSGVFVEPVADTGFTVCGGVPRPSGAGSDTRSPCWSWWRRASSTVAGRVAPSRSLERTWPRRLDELTAGANA